MTRNPTMVLVLFAAALLSSSHASGDAADPEPWPHGENADCNLQNEKLDGFRCEKCELGPAWEFEHDEDACRDRWEAHGYSFVCGSYSTEIWCCAAEFEGVCEPDAGVPIIEAPASGDGDSDIDSDGDIDSDDDEASCSVSLRRKRNLAPQLALVAALIGLGLFVRSRSRR